MCFAIELLPVTYIFPSFTRQPAVPCQYTLDSEATIFRHTFRMALFGSGSQGNNSRNGAYSPVADEEGKPLRDRDTSESDPDTYQTPPEIFALSRSLRRTNLFLKVIIGLLSICIIAILSLNVGDTVKKIIKQTHCADDAPLLKTPVPDRKYNSKPRASV